MAAALRSELSVADEIFTAVRIYVAGPLADIENVRSVQSAVVAAGHELPLDWSRGPDVAFVDDYGSRPADSAEIAMADLDAVLVADAVLIVASEHDGRGMFVELGAALARACRGEHVRIVVIGAIQHESVFYYHPAIQRVATVNEWLATPT
ncbi:hypothetical protein [Leekyejoonella antrihumi]|uniref:Nucleoside 2-deoxyribosyltransferase n=1 Tax=Leekyejoonella antrihumi TaxID=1660198 RepID=A0A563DRP6_9MICO|nr:hypothetical protein [Leekyejoonella antrihumi]TWP32856.1 hypothetical protein FGL98_23100 [Leekyejoonella antrihumi]